MEEKIKASIVNIIENNIGNDVGIFLFGSRANENAMPRKFSDYDNIYQYSPISYMLSIKLIYNKLTYFYLCRREFMLENLSNKQKPIYVCLFLVTFIHINFSMVSTSFADESEKMVKEILKTKKVSSNSTVTRDALMLSNMASDQKFYDQCLQNKLCKQRYSLKLLADKKDFDNEKIKLSNLSKALGYLVKDSHSEIKNTISGQKALATLLADFDFESLSRAESILTTLKNHINKKKYYEENMKSIDYELKGRKVVIDTMNLHDISENKKSYDTCYEDKICKARYGLTEAKWNSVEAAKLKGLSQMFNLYISQNYPEKTIDHDVVYRSVSMNDVFENNPFDSQLILRAKEILKDHPAKSLDSFLTELNTREKTAKALEEKKLADEKKLREIAEKEKNFDTKKWLDLFTVIDHNADLDKAHIILIGDEDHSNKLSRSARRALVKNLVKSQQNSLYNVVLNEASDQSLVSDNGKMGMKSTDNLVLGHWDHQTLQNKLKDAVSQYSKVDAELKKLKEGPSNCKYFDELNNLNTKRNYLLDKIDTFTDKRTLNMKEVVDDIHKIEIKDIDVKKLGRIIIISGDDHFRNGRNGHEYKQIVNGHTFIYIVANKEKISDFKRKQKGEEHVSKIEEKYLKEAENFVQSLVDSRRSDPVGTRENLINAIKQKIQEKRQ
ncbi:MAG: nucleotidyltransferase domain-containing protein [Oligoflexia bacterium]|nr:nucleotidyltransferase domain-containing protein [Oligoflexia bacterium]